MKVKGILKSKGSKVVTVRPDARISTLVQLLHLERIGSAVVSEDGASILGIVTERDIVIGLAKHGREFLEMKVGDVMTREVLTCQPTESIRELMEKMSHRRLRHVPVVEQGRLCGIVSIGDVVKNRLEEMDLESKVLRDYLVTRSAGIARSLSGP